MLDAYPGSTLQVRQDLLVRCVNACMQCSLACTACSDACLAEDDLVHLVKCIRTDLDCAAMCDATVKILTRQTAADAVVVRAGLNACLAAIEACAEECERHAARLQHCEINASVCREAQTACRDLLAALDIPVA